MEVMALPQFHPLPLPVLEENTSEKRRVLQKMLLLDMSVNEAIPAPCPSNTDELKTLGEEYRKEKPSSNGCFCVVSLYGNLFRVEAFRKALASFGSFFNFGWLNAAADCSSPAHRFL